MAAPIPIVNIPTMTFKIVGNLHSIDFNFSPPDIPSFSPIFINTSMPLSNKGFSGNELFLGRLMLVFLLLELISMMSFGDSTAFVFSIRV